MECEVLNNNKGSSCHWAVLWKSQKNWWSGWISDKCDSEVIMLVPIHNPCKAVLFINKNEKCKHWIP